MNFVNLLLVGAGGFLGSMARYAAIFSIERRVQAAFPYGTLAVNVLGSLILGVVLAVVMRKTGTYQEWRLFLGTGFCGGFTTFSAFSAENMMLLHEKAPGQAILYIVVSIAAGLVAVWGAYSLTKIFL